VIGSLSMFRALMSLRWTQHLSCKYIGNCIGPFYKVLGEALKLHKNTLENLDLDLRREPCEDGIATGHPFNPNAIVSRMVEFYQNPDNRPKDWHLLGSLEDFTTLKRLAIDWTALLGDHVWGVSPYQLLELLPSTLEVLILRVQWDNLSNDVRHGEGSRLALHIRELAQSAPVSFPGLKTITLLPIGNYTKYGATWDFPDRIRVHNLIKPACVEARIDFIIDISSVEFSPLVSTPFFREIWSQRNLGRV